ncbi:hypothetical protein HYU19_01825 [Candidatus Woesearchaeota archaeon]|nr:hypothetical protein [Candidatus Woesearchaeota archaeon]
MKFCRSAKQRNREIFSPWPSPWRIGICLAVIVAILFFIVYDKSEKPSDSNTLATSDDEDDTAEGSVESSEGIDAAAAGDASQQLEAEEEQRGDGSGKGDTSDINAAAEDNGQGLPTEQEQEKNETAPPEPAEPDGPDTLPEANLIGDEVELLDDHFDDALCSMAVADAKHDVENAKQVLTEADAAYDAVVADYDAAKQNVDDAILELSNRRSTLIKMRESCTATGKPYG